MKNIVYLGPTFITPSVWMTLARYVFGDLFRALGNQCKITLISDQMPRHAAEGRRYLKDNFGVTFFEVPPHISHEERIARITQMARSIGADVLTNVLAGGTKWGHAAAVVGRELGVRSVVRVSGDEIASFLMQGEFEPDSPVHLYKLALQKESFTLADAVIAMSPWEQRRCQAVIDDEADRDKVKVCMRGVDFARFPYRDKPVESMKKFSYLGRKSMEKSYFLLEDSAVLLEKMAPDVRLLFAGNFDPGREANKIYTGYIDSDKLNGYFDSIDSLLLPSVTEGMPQVVCEAMTKGKPVIVSRHLFQGYLTHGENTLLTGLKANEIARSILMLHKDLELANAISRASREFALENFDKTKWDQVYRDIILG